MYFIQDTNTFLGDSKGAYPSEPESCAYGCQCQLVHVERTLKICIGDHYVYTYIYVVINLEKAPILEAIYVARLCTCVYG